MTKRLGRAIKINRVKRNRNLDELANTAEISQGYLSELERGKYNPSVKTLARIADALGIKLWELLKEAEELDLTDEGE